jgi:hypothetical protein
MASRELIDLLELPKDVLVILDDPIGARLREPERRFTAGVADGAIAAQALFEHPQQHRYFTVDIVVDAHLRLARVQPVKPTRVPDQDPLPGYGERQKQRVEPGVVEALPDVSARGQELCRPCQ